MTEGRPVKEGRRAKAGRNEGDEGRKEVDEGRKVVTTNAQRGVV
jgi:hypothetical protein